MLLHAAPVLPLLEPQKLDNRRVFRDDRRPPSLVRVIPLGETAPAGLVLVAGAPRLPALVQVLKLLPVGLLLGAAVREEPLRRGLKVVQAGIWAVHVREREDRVLVQHAA